ncbi:MAG: hypothetical protein F7C34_02990 [Desulfurococcales archaeon]|nr:hypothetical protein [Desulfurococcales archaeon]
MGSPRRLLAGAALLFIVFIALAPKSPLASLIVELAGMRVLEILQAIVGLTAILLALLYYYEVQLQRPGYNSSRALLATLCFIFAWLAATITFRLVEARYGLVMGAAAAGVVFAVIYVPACGSPPQERGIRAIVHP